MCRILNPGNSGFRFFSFPSSASNAVKLNLKSPFEEQVSEISGGRQRHQYRTLQTAGVYTRGGVGRHGVRALCRKNDHYLTGIFQFLGIGAGLSDSDSGRFREYSGSGSRRVSHCGTPRNLPRLCQCPDADLRSCDDAHDDFPHTGISAPASPEF